MAQKRMFSIQVVDTDKFLDMSTSAQALYFHLGMHGDDDGFVASPKKIARAAGCNDDDLRFLASKGFIIPFDSGVIVITDWNVNNTLKNDRYHETVYQEEKAKISVDLSGKYLLGSGMVPECFQDGSKLEPEPNVTKPNVIEQREGAVAPPKRPRFVPPSIDEVRAYCQERRNGVDAALFVDYYEARGWSVGRSQMKNWKAAIRTWEKRHAADTGKETFDDVV